MKVYFLFKYPCLYTCMSCFQLCNMMLNRIISLLDFIKFIGYHTTVKVSLWNLVKIFWGEFLVLIGKNKKITFHFKIPITQRIKILWTHSRQQWDIHICAINWTLSRVYNNSDLSSFELNVSSVIYYSFSLHLHFTVIMRGLNHWSHILSNVHTDMFSWSIS